LNPTATPSNHERSRRTAARLRRAAALTLGSVMAGHVLLETACDSLFLANVAVDRLPWVTIAIAALAVVASRGRTGDRARVALLTLQIGAAIGTLAFAVLVGDARSWVFYALSLWSGLVTSLIVVRFWLLLGDLFTIVEGKRAFASVAMGGALGALLGSGLAALAAPAWGGQGLLVVSASAFALSSVGPALALGTSGRPRPRRAFAEPSNEPESLGSSIQALVADAYASRIALLVMLGGITLTLGDFLFKSVLTTEIPAAELATWLSRIYLGLNVLSLAMLAIGVTPILRGLGVDRSLSVLPAAIALAAVGALAGSALLSVIFLKLCDGTLRYSLHKTASELLYLPMSSRLRSAIKGAVDIVGQTFAKALASLLLLGLVLLPDPQIAVAVAVLVSALIWVLSSLMLRRAYLDVFRRTLREGTIETAIEHPELDLDSVGSLIRALSDPDARHVVAAMRILKERGHVDLIPSLILYHPSAEVVTRALDVFAATGRDDLGLFLDRLIDHEDAMVRAAAVRATWVLDPDVARLEALRTNHCAVVRVSTVAGLLALGAADESEYAASLQEALDYPSYEPRLAASTAARLRYHPVNRNALLRMASDEDYEVAQEAVRAIAESGDAWYTPALVSLLGDRRIRDGVRRALIERGDPALEVLANALVDPETPTSVLRHVPRTIALFRVARGGAGARRQSVAGRERHGPLQAVARPRDAAARAAPARGTAGRSIGDVDRSAPHPRRARPHPRPLPRPARNRAPVRDHAAAGCAIRHPRRRARRRSPARQARARHRTTLHAARPAASRRGLPLDPGRAPGRRRQGARQRPGARRDDPRARRGLADASPRSGPAERDPPPARRRRRPRARSRDTRPRSDRS
jgi:AAA family ATP:ADP antiporter